MSNGQVGYDTEARHPEPFYPTFGWQQSLPDYRDYRDDSPRVRELFTQLVQRDETVPPRADLREYFPSVADQQNVNSCSAQAVTGLAEYYQRRALGNTERLSALFLYKTTRKLLGLRGDTGADLRTSLKALVRFDLPPARFHVTATRDFDQDPDPHLYNMARSFRSLVYWRLDSRHATGDEVLTRVRAYLAAGFPVAFGFPVTPLAFECVDIPYRPECQPVIGGQAVLAVGYDDRRFRVTRGALLIRSSWGAAWGDQGYGWLPYEYVRDKLAVEFWTAMCPACACSGEFDRPPEPARTARSAEVRR